MKKILIVLLGLFLTSLSAEVVSKTYSKTATGEGYGVTYEQAVDNALAQAVLKLNGAYVKTSQSSQTTMIKDGNDANLISNFNQKISKATNGRFSTFDVISSSQDANGFRVVVEVKKTSTVKSYKAPGRQDNRRRIIVVPALEPNVYSIMGRDGEQVLRDLRFKIESSVYKTRKFNLLDRQAGAARADEAELLRATAPKDELLKLGQTMGTDYILMYSISDAQKSEGKAIKIIGGKAKDELYVFANYQVIIMATGETRLADSISLKYRPKDDHARSYNAILENLADTIVANVQSAIYPPIVEKVSNNQAVFAQSISVGSKLDCFKKGAKIVDSYTKVTAGYEEIPTAKIEITSSNLKMSYATIIEGSLTKGDICRITNLANKDNSNSDANGKEVKDVVPVSGGGFIF